MVEFVVSAAAASSPAVSLTPSEPILDVSPGRSGAAARAAALHARARVLGAAQAQVHALAMEEVATLAGAAAHFFDALALPEFSGSLLPSTARSARRMRQVMHTTEGGATLRALLLGRDAQLRLFTARSATARDFVAATEPGGTSMIGVSRDIDDWTTRYAVPDFRTADVLARLSSALDDVERRLAAAERRIAMQRRALLGGDSEVIRETLARGTEAPRSPAGVGRPSGPRLTPALGARVVRPPSRTPAIGLPSLPPSPALPPSLAAIAPVTPEPVPVVPEPIESVPTAANTADDASMMLDMSVDQAAASEPVGGADASIAAPAAAEPQPGESAEPVIPAAAAPPARGGWLSRAFRAAVRTPGPSRPVR